MAAISTTLGLIATSLSAIGTIGGAISANQQAQYEAKIYEQQAERERIIAKGNEEDFRRNQSAAMAEYRAAAGGSGVEIGRGSPLLTFADFGAETELQAQRIREGGEVTATRLEQQAGLSRMAGRNAMLGGLARGGARLLTGISSYNANRRIPAYSSAPSRYSYSTPPSSGRNYYR